MTEAIYSAMWSLCDRVKACAQEGVQVLKHHLWWLGRDDLVLTPESKLERNWLYCKSRISLFFFLPKAAHPIVKKDDLELSVVCLKVILRLQSYSHKVKQ